MRSLSRRNLNKWAGIDFCGVRLRKPQSCEDCPYHHTDFKYRNCVYVRCVYDRTKITLRDEPLREPDVVERKRREAKPWEKQQLRQ